MTESITYKKDDLAKLIDQALEGFELKRKLDRIGNFETHLRLEIDKAYGCEYDVVEYGSEGNPYEAMDNLIGILEGGLRDAKALRGHTHEWVTRYHDGRDLACYCAICGADET